MDALLAVIAIIGVATITPGPNNFIVLTSAARGGLRAAAPLIGGIVAGGLVMLGLAWIGVAAAVAAEPRLGASASIAGAGYLAWLGAGLLREAGRAGGAAAAAPPHSLPETAIGVAVFQIVNPKAWLLVLAATTTMVSAVDGPRGLALLGAIFVTLSSAALAVWAFGGALIGRWLGAGRARRAFDAAMGTLLIALAVTLLLRLAPAGACG